mgnify:FL=1|tara:strand:- start:1922 stop:2353 length:432 start_codon:yes stop_codon:yes gene_type:complete
MDPNANLTQIESNKQMLMEMRNMNLQLRQMIVYQQQAHEHLRDLSHLVNGFTNGGASLNGYIPDAFVQAYLSVVAPILAERLGKEEVNIEELMKGATLLARQLLEELSAYRSEQEAKDIISEVLAHVNDPWDHPDNAPSEIDP